MSTSNSALAPNLHNCLNETKTLHLDRPIFLRRSSCRLNSLPPLSQYSRQVLKVFLNRYSDILERVQVNISLPISFISKVVSAPSIDCTPGNCPSDYCFIDSAWISEISGVILCQTGNLGGKAMKETYRKPARPEGRHHSQLLNWKVFFKRKREKGEKKMNYLEINY